MKLICLIVAFLFCSVSVHSFASPQQPLQPQTFNIHTTTTLIVLHAQKTTDDDTSSALATEESELVVEENEEPITLSSIALAVAIAAASVTFLVLQSLALSCIVLATLLFVANRNNTDGSDENSFPKMVFDGTTKSMELPLPEINMMRETPEVDEETLTLLQAKITALEQVNAELQDMVELEESDDTAATDESLESRISELEQQNEELERWKTEKILVEKASNEYTVPELRAIAKEHSLDDTGNKKELLERLVKHDLI